MPSNENSCLNTCINNHVRPVHAVPSGSKSDALTALKVTLMLPLTLTVMMELEVAFLLQRNVHDNSKGRKK
jgi:hypothetical protein